MIRFDLLCLCGVRDFIPFQQKKKNLFEKKNKPKNETRALNCFTHELTRTIFFLFRSNGNVFLRLILRKKKKIIVISIISSNLIFFFSVFVLQQLFRSQNPSLASNAGVPPQGPTAQPPIPQTLSLPSQQYLAQQNAAYATQQPTPYVINAGQDAAQYMGLIPGTNQKKKKQKNN